MPTWRALPTPTEIVEHLDRFVRGQERAKRDLATCVYRHYLAIAYAEQHPGVRSPFGKRHLLLLGPTGAGKTYLVKTLAQFLGVPLAFGSAASLVENGYYGEHLDTVFGRLMTAARDDMRLAECGIVFLDEIDKIRRQEVGSRDVAGEGVQTSLLAPLDGCPVDLRAGSFGSTTFDTSKTLFICTGAFAGLPELIRQRLRRGASFGFAASGEDHAALSDDEALGRGELQDLEAYGFIPEFLGRFAVISRVKSLSRDELVAILRDTEDSPLARQRCWFAQHGVDLVVAEEALETIADLAIQKRTNARGLERLLAKTLANLDYQLPELSERGVRCVRITREAILGEARPAMDRATAPVPPPVASAGALRRRVAALLGNATGELDHGGAGQRIAVERGRAARSGPSSAGRRSGGARRSGIRRARVCGRKKRCSKQLLLPFDEAAPTPDAPT